MRQFILGGNVAYSTGATPAEAPAGAVGLYYLKDGQLAIDSTGANMGKEGAIVLGRGMNNGGPVVLPFYNHHFSYVKAEYSAATAYSASFTVGDPTIMEDHTVIFVKKGVQFNERANWTATVHVYKTGDTAANVAKQIADYVNNNPLLGLKATVADATVTVTGVKKGIDYNIVPADALYGMEVTQTSAKVGFMDAEYIKRLARMASADAGIEYTYMDDVHYLYPGYPFNPLAQVDGADAGYTVYTLRFAVPRAVKTRDEVVHQIVQIAFPTGAAAITTMDTVLAKVATL